jgi:hypothetical protein
MGNSYPLKIGTKLDDAGCPDYRPDGRVCPGHLTGRQNPTSGSHSNATAITCYMGRYRCVDMNKTRNRIFDH